MGIYRAVVYLALFSLVCIGQGAIHQPQWKPTGGSAFKVGTQLRPWAIQDEGWDTIFANMEMAGVNNVAWLVVSQKKQNKFAAFIKKGPYSNDHYYV